MTARLARPALMFGNLIIGMSVMAPAGMLPELAEGLGVTVRDAGLLITFGAAVLCFGSPLVAWASAGMDRRLLLVGTLGILALGHAASAFAPNYATLLALRLAMLAVAAVFTPQAASTIASIVSERERPGAIAFVFLGWSLAVALGLPLITFLASHGGWRVVYGTLAAAGVISVMLVTLALPSGLKGAPVSLASWGRIVKDRPILLLLTITLLSTAGQFMVFIYFGPLLVAFLDAGPTTIALFFFTGGFAGFIGNVAASRMVGTVGPFRTSAIFIGLMLAGLLIWTLGAGNLWIMAFASVTMGLGFAAANSMQQARLAAAAPALASATIALNTSSIYVGQAIGSFIAAILFAQGFLTAMGFGACVFMAAALAMLSLTRPRAGGAKAVPA